MNNYQIKTSKFTLRLTKAEFERLNKMKVRIQARSLSEVIRRAIIAYDQQLKEES